MKILIIGSEGFIGTHAVSYFISKGYIVNGADLFQVPTKPYVYYKISNFALEIDEILQNDQFNVIVNCSGSANVSFSINHPLVDFESNCHNTITLLDGIRRFQPNCKYIHLSSAAVYGNPTRLPVSEESLLKPLSPYGYHKLLAENICKEYTDVYGVQTALLRPFSVYGVGQTKLMFWDVFQRARNSESAIELFGTGFESRDYINIKDLVYALDLIIEKSPMKATEYNIASGHETTISEAIKIFFSKLNPNQAYYFNNQVRKGDPLNWRADIGKISELGFKPSITLDEGLEEVVTWLKSV